MAEAVTTLLLYLLSTLSLSAATLHHQSLLVAPLPDPTSLSSDPDLPWSFSDNLSASDHPSSSTSLYLRLEHRDSLLPTNSTSPDDLLRLRLSRDSARVASLLSRSHRPNASVSASGGFSGSVISGLSQGSGEYFTRIGVGTPPRYLYMVLDTGSDLVWLQCAPCRRCYSQADPVFNPGRSRSFATVRCGSPICRHLDVSGCERRRTCLYQVSYGDGSFTVGEFSTETLTFRGVKVPAVALGCGHDNEGLFVGAAGLLGLGRGRLSFPSQAGRRFGRKFSYCLVTSGGRAAGGRPGSSYIIFGDSAVPRSAIFTPLLSNPRLDTFYYISLTGISVGGARVAGISKSVFRLDPAGNGGVIVDSGTSVTRLVRPAYIALRDAFVAGATGLRRAAEFSLFDTCYDLSGLTEVKVPTVVFHFAGGADVSLPAANYLIPVNSQGVFCFAFAGNSNGLSIIGNIQQQGFRVVFDGDGSRLGFAPGGCT